MRFSIAFAAASAVLASAIFGTNAASAERVQWQPVGQWRIDAAGERCAAFQAYSLGKDRVTLAFQARPMSDQLKLLLEAPGKSPGIRVHDGKLDFGAGRTAKSAFVGRSSKPRHLIYDIAVSRGEVEQVASSGRLFVSISPLKLELPTGQLGRSIGLLDACMANLLERWGLSKDDQARIARFPEPEKSLHSYVSDSDYPVDAVRRGAIGAVEARVMVDEAGSVSNCQMVDPTHHLELDQMTCRVVSRARFRPAVDRDGRPMASPYYFSIRWIMTRGF